MNLLCITDIHGDGAALQQILERERGTDLVLLGGDLTNFGTPGDAGAIVDAVLLAGHPVLAVAGNCDSAEIDELLASRDVSLHGRGRVVDGVGFHGVSAMPPWGGSMYELTEEQIGDLLASGYDDVAGCDRHVVLSHPPPRDAVDRTSSGKHVGSTAVRAWVESRSPALVVCGHVHESRGAARIGETVVVNCGPAFRGSYAVIELDGAVVADVRRIEYS